jgi:hypothetical protein
MESHVTHVASAVKPSVKINCGLIKS